MAVAGLFLFAIMLSPLEVDLSAVVVPLILLLQVFILALQASISRQLTEIERWRDTPRIEILEVMPVRPDYGTYRIALVNRGGRGTAIENTGTVWLPRGDVAQGLGLDKDVRLLRIRERPLPLPEGDRYESAREHTIEPGAIAYYYFKMGEKTRLPQQIVLHMTVKPVIGEKIQKKFEISTWEALTEVDKLLGEKQKQGKHTQQASKKRKPQGRRRTGRPAKGT